MTEDERDGHSDDGGDYEPPAIEWEEAFDVEAGLASACGKIGGSGGSCNVTPMS